MSGAVGATMRKLRRCFYDRETIVVARELLGKYLVHNSAGVERIGKIVEVEAYLGPHDLAAHSAKGLPERTKNMFGRPGHAHDLLSDEFSLAEPDDAGILFIVKRPRIGVDYAKHWAKRRLRFYIKGNA